MASAASSTPPPPTREAAHLRVPGPREALPETPPRSSQPEPTLLEQPLPEQPSSQPVTAEPGPHDGPATAARTAGVPGPAAGRRSVPALAGVGPVGRRRLVGLLVAGPPLAVLVGVAVAAALDVSAPAATLLTGPSADAGPGVVLVRLVAVGLLVAAALAVHDAVGRRSPRDGVAAVVAVVGAAPVGGLALVEPVTAAVASGLLAAVLGAAAFVRRRASHAGFTAGLLLAAVVVLAPVAAVVALLVALTASRWPGSVLRAEPGAGRAVALVLSFPVLALGGAWAYLAWRVPHVLPGGSPLTRAWEVLEAAGHRAVEVVTGAGSSLAAADGLPAGVVAGAVPALVLGAVLARGRTRTVLSLLAATAGLLTAVVTV